MGAEGAAPGEGCCCSRLSAPAPLPDGPRSGCSGPPPPGSHWLTRWGNRGWEWLKVTKETVGQPVTSPVTVDPGSEGVLAPKEAGAWQSGPADWAERRASRNDRRGPSRPRLSPSALGRGGRAGRNGELLRAPRLSPSPVHSLASYRDIAGPGRTHHSAQAGLQGGCQIPVPPTPRRPGATLPQNCRVGSGAIHRVLP